MVKDIRTSRGKLVGRLNEQTGILSIKNGKKVVQIKIPPNGLRLIYTPGDGISEDIYIPPSSDNPHIAQTTKAN